MCECRSVCRSRLLWCFLSKWIKIHHKKWVKLSSNKEKRNVCRSVWRFLRDLCVVVFYSAACVADFAQFRVLSIKETWNSVKHNESLVQPCAVRTCWNSQNNHDASVVNKSEVFDASGDKLTLYTQNTHTHTHADTHTHTQTHTHTHTSVDNVGRRWRAHDLLEQESCRWQTCWSLSVCSKSNSPAGPVNTLCQVLVSVYIRNCEFLSFIGTTGAPSLKL